jgi:hypothetical protein
MFYMNSGFPLFLLIFLGVLFIIMLRYAAGTRRWRRDERGWQHGPRQHDATESFRGAQAGASPGDTVVRDYYSAAAWECSGPDCRAPNPPHARFCRMCGREKV